MDKLPFRQVNLDFHTSECMPYVGSEFSEDDFKNALQTGHISSITLFAKCHHGWSYFPTHVNEMHPTLKTNLLDRQLKVCEELGVRAQIYISAGLDERKANKYPQFRTMLRNENNTLLGAHWHHLCLNNDEYLERLEYEADIKKHIGERLGSCIFSYPIFLQHYIDLFWNCGSPVGSGRGSSSAGLNHYLLGVTQSDPIKTGSPFWRYLNKERVELPKR